MRWVLHGDVACPTMLLPAHPSCLSDDWQRKIDMETMIANVPALGIRGIDRRTANVVPKAEIFPHSSMVFRSLRLTAPAGVGGREGGNLMRSDVFLDDPTPETY